MSGSRGRGSGWRVIAGTALWLAVACGGMGALVDHATRPGDPGGPSPRWPDSSRIPRPAGRPVLVMFAHPRCPCTRASLGELARIMARVRGRAATHVLFLKPAGVGEDWWRTDLWESAAAIPGVTVLLDEKGSEAGLFGAATSGQTLLYDAEGNLVFSGGITGARGHSGDNIGRSRLVALIEGEQRAGSSGPVFGCSLREPAAANRKVGEPWKM